VFASNNASNLDVAMIRYIHPWPSGPVRFYVQGDIVYSMNGRPVFFIVGQFLRQAKNGPDLYRISGDHLYRCGVIGNPEFYFA
jgi:hypothetical protein